MTVFMQHLHLVPYAYMVDGHESATDGWQPPRCIHGEILLGCPHEDCPTQTAYLDQQDAALRGYEERQKQAAHRIVRDMFGLP